MNRTGDARKQVRQIVLKCLVGSFFQPLTCGNSSHQANNHNHLVPPHFLWEAERKQLLLFDNIVCHPVKQKPLPKVYCQVQCDSQLHFSLIHSLCFLLSFTSPFVSFSSEILCGPQTMSGLAECFALYPPPLWRYTRDHSQSDSRQKK